MKVLDSSFLIDYESGKPEAAAFLQENADEEFIIPSTVYTEYLLVRRMPLLSLISRLSVRRLTGRKSGLLRRRLLTSVSMRSPNCRRTLRTWTASTRPSSASPPRSAPRSLRANPISSTTLSATS